MDIIMSLVGMASLILIGVIFSKNRRAIRLRTVIGAFIIQFVLGALVLFYPPGQQALNTVSDGVQKVISYGKSGFSTVFGSLSGHPEVGTVIDGKFTSNGLIVDFGFIFVLNVLPLIVFFSSLIAVLYYLGIMQWIIRIIGGALHKILGTSRAESMSAAANIFVGQTEAPLVVKPFIKTMTESELFAIMCGGLASIAGSILAGYANLGVPVPYLIAASFMAAPGGLLFAKLLLPETEKSQSDAHMARSFSSDDDAAPTSVIDAAASGATTGMHIALNVGAMLIAFIALIALIDGILGGIGSWFNQGDLSLNKIFGWIFSPIAWLIGTPWADAQTVGTFLGEKLAINEFVAYLDVKNQIDGGILQLAPKTMAIVYFALCGFANFSSIAILVGGLTIMAPNRRSDIARLGLYALLAGTLSNLMSATIAGFFVGLSNGSILGIGS